jgi:hypothetical protein
MGAFPCNIFGPIGSIVEGQIEADEDEGEPLWFDREFGSASLARERDGGLYMMRL